MINTKSESNASVYFVDEKDINVKRIKGSNTNNPNQIT